MGYVCHAVPSIWVCFLIIAVPQNGSVSEPFTHTSGHRLCKSTPGENNPDYSKECDLENHFEKHALDPALSLVERYAPLSYLFFSIQINNI